MNKKTLILFDRFIDNDEDVSLFVSWSEMVVPIGTISLPAKTDEHSEKLKAEFLNWHHEFGQTEIKGQSLISYLKIFENLSFWWLTSVAEKSPFLSKSIFQVFKLRTLEIIYSEMNCQRLIYRGSHKPLHSVLKAWAHKLGHSYEWDPSSSDISKGSVKGFYKYLIHKSPYCFQVIVWFLKRWYCRWQHANLMLPNEKNPDPNSRPTIVTFFPNIHMNQARKGIFRSKYWGKLHDYLETKNIPADWVWFYFGSNELSFKESIQFKNECNRKSTNHQKYFLLEEFLDFSGLWKSLVLYLRLRRKAHGLNQLQNKFCFPNSKINFFPIMENDWNHSLFGVGAIEKITWAVMFDAMAQKLPASPWGLYTWENQTWEKALVSAWNRHNPGRKVFGYEHSSLRLMDLRLFSDPRTYQGKGIEEFPIPDMLGINSSIGLEWMRKSEYPPEKTTRLEALRYFHLNGKFGCFKKPTPPSGRKLLMIGGIIPEEVRFQIQLLKQAEEKGGLEKYDEVWIKPHPGLTLDFLLKDFKPKFKFNIVTRPIIELMEESDVAYCANSTGASLEAAWIGVPLIILAAYDSINLNPLFGFSDQTFIKDCAGLVSALENPKTIKIPEDYFFLDEKLLSWKNLLESTELPKPL